MKYTCDPYKQVRDSAFKCIEIGLQRLKQHAMTMSDKPIEANPNNQSNANNSQKAEASYLSSWASKISGYTDSGKNTESQNTSKDEDIKQNGNKSKEEENVPSYVPNNNKMPSAKQKKYDDDDIDDIFASNESWKSKPRTSPGMKLKQKEKIQIKPNENKKDLRSLDDFLASFNDDLNKQKASTSDILPKSKIKYKNKGKKQNKKPRKVKTGTTSNNNNNSKTSTDDFFDDW